MFVLLLCAASLLAPALACTAGADDGVACSSPDPLAVNATCVNGECVWTCPAGYSLNNNICTVTCEAIPLPAFGAVVSCASTFVGSVCQLTCLSPTVSSGQSSRTCLSNGLWSGTPLSCTMPNPCNAKPCLGASFCIEDLTAANYYVCNCTTGATGTPGPDGSGCIIPTVSSSGGNVQLSVSDQNDVVFQVGLNTHSAKTFDSRINAIVNNGGTIDQKVSTASAQLSTTVTNAIVATNSQTTASLTSLIQSGITNAIASAAADATTKSNNAIATANVAANSYAQGALSNAVSTSKAQNSQTQVNLGNVQTTLTNSQSAMQASLSSSIYVTTQSFNVQIAAMSNLIITQSTAMSTLASTVTSQTATISSHNSCAASGLIYDGTTSKCLSAISNIGNVTNGQACTSVR